MKYDVYNTQGKKSGAVELPERVFDVAWNDALMHQVITSMQDNARTPVAHVKTRGDVRGGGRKPWQQKGTGRARHGSIRSPIWRGGGVTHGPRNEKSYTRTIPKKMRARALAMALSRKLRDGEVIFVDTFGIDVPKTAAAKKVLVSLGSSLGAKNMSEKRANATLIALADPRAVVLKSFQNIGNVECRAVRELNPVSIMKNSYLVIENPEEAVAILSHRVGVSAGEKKETPKKTKRIKKDSKSIHEMEKGDQ